MKKQNGGPPPQHHDAAYWLGWHAGAVRKALIMLEAVDAEGRPATELQDVIAVLRLAWDTFIESGDTAVGPFVDGHQQTWAGFVVEAATGEAQAMRETRAGAVAAIDQAEMYWDEAATCGHPDAPGYVALKYPFRIRQITRQEWDDILEDGQPVLDREP